MPTQQPPSGVEPKTPSTTPGHKSSPVPSKSGPGGLSGGANVGANEPGRTGNFGRQDG